MKSFYALLLCAFAASGNCEQGTQLNQYWPPSQSVGFPLGASVAAIGNQILVGAPSSAGTGGVFLYNQYSTPPPVVLQLAHPAGLEPHLFGTALATTGSQILASDIGGIELLPSALSSLGAVAIYNSPVDSNPALILNPEKDSHDEFGRSLAWGPGGYYVVGAPTYSPDSITSVGRAYIYHTSSTNPVHILDNPSSATATLFGTAIAVSADGMLAITAPGDVAGGNGGEVTLFNLTTGAYLRTISNPGMPGDDFGRSVAIIGSRLAVGAPARPQTHGIVYQFNRQTGDLEVSHSHSFEASGHSYGYSLGVLGENLVVGKLLDHRKWWGYFLEPVGMIFVVKPGTDELLHFVFTQTGAGYSIATIGGYILTGTLSPSDLPAVSMATLVTGSGNHMQRLGTPSSPAATAIDPTRIDVNFTDTATFEEGFQIERLTLIAPDTETPYYGDTVLFQLATDVTSFADTTVETDKTYCYRIRSFAADWFSEFTASVCASTFSPDGSGLVQQYTGLPEQRLGTSIALLTGLRGAKHAFAAGAPGDSDASLNSGVVNIYSLKSTSPLRTISNPSPNQGDQFGTVVRASGKNIFVSAPADDTHGENSGLVYMFSAETGNLLRTFQSPRAAAGRAFGYQVAAIGKNEVAISESYNFEHYVYLFNTKDGALVRELVNPEGPGSTGDSFGSALADFRGRLVVAANASGWPGHETDQIYGYDRNGSIEFELSGGDAIAPAGKDGVIGNWNINDGPQGAWLIRNAQRVMYFIYPGLEVPTSFGRVVAGCKTHVVVGAPGYEVGTPGHVPYAPSSGQAYLYTKKLTNAIHVFRNPSPGNEDVFSSEMEMNDDYVFITAPQDDSSGLDNGAIYVYSLKLLTD